MPRNPNETPEEKAERLRRHEEGRRKKRVTLGDITKELPPDADTVTFFKLTIDESDRGVVIMATALLEAALTKAIRWRIVDPGETITKSWFEGPTAPFGTFAAKIQLGRALSIYGPHMAERLSVIKEIRNTFSHRPLPLDFSHPVVREEVDKLRIFKPVVVTDPNPRLFFSATCTIEAMKFEVYVKNAGNKLSKSSYL